MANLFAVKGVCPWLLLSDARSLLGHDDDDVMLDLTSGVVRDRPSITHQNPNDARPPCHPSDTHQHGAMALHRSCC